MSKDSNTALHKDELNKAFRLGFRLLWLRDQEDKYLFEILDFYKSHSVDLTEKDLEERRVKYLLLDQEMILKESQKSDEFLFFNAGLMAANFAQVADCGEGGVLFYTKENIEFYETFISLFGFSENERESHLERAIDFFHFHNDKQIDGYFEFLYQNYKICDSNHPRG